jgi:hypothetical protein
MKLKQFKLCGGPLFSKLGFGTRFKGFWAFIKLKRNTNKKVKNR